MCGIAGFFAVGSRDQVPARAGMLEAQISTLSHRGPDWQQVLNGPGVGLAHARLSIIDLSDAAHQPMGDEAGRVQIVFNGEIYNFQSLRSELEALGHRFRTRSDTEVIVQGYLAWGLDVIKRLRGMFAVALWDIARDRLVLFRDRVGKKPLIWTMHDGVLLFASEIKGVLAWPGVPRRPDWGAIHDYLTFQYVPAPHTAFEGIHKLPPGHLMVFERGNGEPRIERYYELPGPRSTQPQPVEALREELVHRLREATRLRMISDVPLGAFLSGGVDSSSVVAMMALESTNPVKTFTIGFEEQVYDERPYARGVVERYKTDHHELVVRPDGMAVLPRIVWHYGEPFADSSAIPTYYVSEIARRHVTVALNGDGGDESFLGYPRYVNYAAQAKLGAQLPAPVREVLAASLDRLPAGLRASRIAEALRRHVQPTDLPSRRYEQFIAYFSDAAKVDIYGAGMKRFLATSSLDRLDPWLLESDSPAAAAAWADIHTYLPDDLLVKVDIASMAHSLECRSPLLDAELMHWAAGIPAETRLQGTETKALFKQAMEPYLPHDLLYRPKMGFGVPIDRWIAGDMKSYVYATLLEGPARQRGLFDLDRVRALLDGHCNGIGNAPRIWALLMLELWLQMYIDKSDLTRPPAPTLSVTG